MKTEPDDRTCKNFQPKQPDREILKKKLLYIAIFFNPTSRLVTGFLVNKNNLRHFTWFSPDNVLLSSQPKTHLDLHSSSYHYSARCFVQISDVSGHHTRETVSFEPYCESTPFIADRNPQNKEVVKELVCLLGRTVHDSVEASV